MASGTKNSNEDEIDGVHYGHVFDFAERLTSKFIHDQGFSLE